MSKPPGDDEPFLSRWSRRKREIAGQATAGEPIPKPTGTADASEAEPLDLDTLPRIEDIDQNSDISVFLDKRVPAMLRNAALSRMWTLDPTIRDFIEVAENQWNWNVPGGAPFYEEMTGSVEVAHSIVQGGGGLLRDGLAQTSISGEKSDAGGPYTLVDSDALPDSSPGTPSREIEIAVDSHDATHNAERQVVQSVGASPVGEDATAHPDRTHSGELVAKRVDDAPQQSLHEHDHLDVVRRRHGGALPI